MKWIRIAIGGAIALSVLPVIVTIVDDLTGAGGVLANDGTAKTLLTLVPMVFVAGILGFLLLKTGKDEND